MQQINIKEYFKQQKDELRQSDVKPSLTIINATNGDAGNQIYIQKKVDDFNELGWPVSVIKVPEHWTPADLNSIDTDCIIAQMPLRDSLSSFSIDVIPTIKDCDGLTSSTLVLPATVRRIVDYLDDCGFKYEGKSALILGRSNIVGKPMAKELLARNMTVSICHSKTNVNAKLYLARIADLVVSAVGDFTLTREACPHAIVVDVGIRRNQANFIQGDFVIAKRNNSCGLLTRLGLMKNCLQLAKQARR